MTDDVIQVRRRGGWLVLLAVLTVCAGLRLWLISSAEIIAKDGAVYIAMARRWQSDPGGVIRDNDYHVAYPAAVAAAHRAGRRLGLADNVGDWETAARTVTLTAGLAALIAGWLIGRRAIGWPAASLGILLVGVGRKFASTSVDVISDPLAICLQAWGLVAALAALDRLRVGRRAWPFAAAAGLAVGAGYLVRPESLLLLPVIVVVWGGFALLGRDRPTGVGRRTVACAGLLVLFATATASPYMIAIGGLTKKKSISRLATGDATTAARPQPVFEMTATCYTVEPAAVGSAPLLAETTSAGKAVVEFVGQLFEAMQPMVAALACIWLITWLGWRWLRVRLPADVRLTVSNDYGLMIGTFLALVGMLLIRLQMVHGYISHRHLMLAALLLSPLAGAGAIILAAWLRRGTGRLARPGQVGAAAFSATLVVLTLSAGTRTVFRPVGEDIGYRDAGQRTVKFRRDGDYLLVSNYLFLHYADMPGERLDTEGQFDPDRLAERLARGRPGTLILLGDNDFDGEGAKLAAELAASRGFTRLDQCPRRQDESGELMHLFRIELPPSPATQPNGGG